ncbi:hypothetical protein BAY61_31725 (plasmid) [Prauserella marina]|uniref:Uncharacterized protein n=1 Tax=Prauserella marina TaxID=530584 RepID=A0A222W0W3_9PSEU|nr:hypothetical protein [Prauserella marina]ASR39858.1 hypothetical protein BAY61_31725 [Prauserella marina]PWV71349.1 hypothetical protein DES30_11265 [Prauserella marina]SDD96044.1 hypothetical protein SAMN05421630_11547 [Prauserella marina]
MSKKKRNQVPEPVEQHESRMKAATKSALHRNSYQARPLMINTSALATGFALHDISPTAGAIVGGGAALVTAVNAWLGRMSDEERQLLVMHGAAAGAWSIVAGIAGPLEAAVGVAGAVGAVASHTVWAERRKIRKPKLSERPVYDEWNDEDYGILADAGYEGVRMFGREPILTADGKEQIGFYYHLDLSGSSVTADAFIAMGVNKIEAALPGKTRKGAVKILEDPDDVNHVIVEIIWRKQWSLDQPVLHPVVEHLDQLHELVQSAVEHHMSDGAVPAKPIPAHLRNLMPGMATIRNPIAIGVTPNREIVTNTIYRKGYGAMQEYGAGVIGSGKTSRINCEICSLLPCRDVVIWAIDLSAKRGKHFKPWGGCIDWLATTAKEARDMLRAAKAIANARGLAYDNTAIVSPKRAPIIRIIIDELPALFDEMDASELHELLSMLTKQSRSQGISLDMWTQRANQTDHGYGFQSIVSQCGNRTVMKVLTSKEVGGVLENSELVQVDPTQFLPGEQITQNVLTNEMVHSRSFLVREADDDLDDDDERGEGAIDLGDIPAIAALYAPFRPKLDAVSAKAAGEAYANRDLNVPENPLLTPQEVMTPQFTAPPESAAEVDELVQQFKTNVDWLDAVLTGRMTVGYIDDEEGKTMDTSTLPEIDTADILLDRDIPIGNNVDAREDRAHKMKARLQERLAATESGVEELTQQVATIPRAVPLSTAAAQEQPKQFPDTDPIIVAAVETMGKHAGKGAPMSAIQEAAEKALGKKTTSETVRARLRDLNYREKAVLAGKGRGARWYLPHHVPAAADSATSE